ncbi:MAG: hypothetical protein IJU57_06455 [Clostridia bacterium]|nr:hypothetical protein [Clostridia bacterium]
MIRKITAFLICALMLLTLCACGLSGGGGSGGSGNDPDNSSGNNSSALYTKGKWAGMYGTLGIDEPETGGKLVYTANDGDENSSYQYEMCYKGLTREELISWVDKLVAKGFRISDSHRERLENSSFNDVTVYLPEEKQKYRLKIQFDYKYGMGFEWYGDDDPAFVITPGGDDEYDTIQYDVQIWLNPMKTEQVFSGSFDGLGLKADDLKLLDNLRGVEISTGTFMNSLWFMFYSDHLTTSEEVEALRTGLIDKLASNGCTFALALNPDEKVSADDLKGGGYGTYIAELNGTQYLIMVNPDSSSGDFGDSYGVMIQQQSK